MHTFVTEERNETFELYRKHKVARLEVFGSAARAAAFNLVTRDVDFLVKFDSASELGPFHCHFDFRYALQELLDRLIDLVELGVIRNCYLKTAIDKSGGVRLREATSATCLGI